jgi:transposase
VCDKVCSRDGVEHVGCWAHARQGFSDAKKASSKAGSADEAIAMIVKLYVVEADRPRFESEAEFVALRRAHVEPILTKLRAWLERRANQVPLSCVLGKAIGYTLGQWPRLIRYLDHAVLSPDTNACEQAIRPFVVGRKNWLFSGSPRGPLQAPCCTASSRPRRPTDRSPTPTSADSSRASLPRPPPSS